jgi:hypothetical protein
MTVSELRSDKALDDIDFLRGLKPPETENRKEDQIRPGFIFGGGALVSGSRTYLVSSEVVHENGALVWEGPTIRAISKTISSAIRKCSIPVA